MPLPYIAPRCHAHAYTPPSLRSMLIDDMPPPDVLSSYATHPSRHIRRLISSSRPALLPPWFILLREFAISSCYVLTLMIFIFYRRLFFFLAYAFCICASSEIALKVQIRMLYYQPTISPRRQLCWGYLRAYTYYSPRVTSRSLSFSLAMRYTSAFRLLRAHYHACYFSATAYADVVIFLCRLLADARAR